MYRYDTRLLTCFQQLNRLTLLMPVVLLLAFGLSAAELSAQSSATPKNVYVPLTGNTYEDLNVDSFTCLTEVLGSCVLTGSFSNESNLIDGNLNNAATSGVLSLGTNWIEVIDNNATGTDLHPAGSYAGFVVSDGLLSLLGGVTVTVYNDDTSDSQSVSGVGLLGLSLGGTAKVGFYPTIAFNRIRVTFGGVALGSRRVYYAEILTPDDTIIPDLSETCNLPTPWVQGTISDPASGFPVVIEPERTGDDSFLNVGGIDGLGNVVNSNTDDAATLTSILSAAGEASISVRTLGDDPLEGGTFAGFEVSMNQLLSLNILGKITINTYLNGDFQNSASGNSLIASVGLLGSSDRYTIGFQTTDPFDEIQITLDGGLIGLSVSTFNVYHPVVTNFCPGADLTCLTDTPISTPAYPVFINAVNTGVTGLASTCLLGDCIEDMDNLINEYPNEGAVITPLLSSGSANISVKFGAGSYGGDDSNPVFVGFDIENASLLDVDVLDEITITTYLNGNPTGESSDDYGGPLVEANTDLLSGTGGRRTVGFAATEEFDEVQLSINGIASVSLGETTVSQLILRELCPGEPGTCGETTNLTSDAHPVLANYGRGGLVCVDCTVDNIDHLVSPDPDEYTSIHTTASVLTAPSVSVENPVDTYPGGTIAGFIIDTGQNNLVEADLLNGLEICTHNDGSQVECKSGSELITLTVLLPLLGPQTGVFNIGFETTGDYDTIELRIPGLLDANVLDGSVDIYNAYVDYSTVGGDGESCPAIEIELTGGSCFRTLSSPVAGLTYAEMLAPLWTQGIPGSDYNGSAPAADPNVWTWPLNASDNTGNWVPLANMDDVIPAGSGFLMSVFDQDDFDDPNSDGWPKTITIPAGPQNASVLSGSMMNENPGGWTLAGNPLQSNIDVTKLTTTGLTDAYYVYDRNLSGETDGNPGGWRSTADGYGDIVDNAIAVGQGFFVQNTSAGSPQPSIIFGSNARTDKGEFYGKEKEERKDFVRFELNGESTFSSAWVRFSDQGSNEHTYGDALKLAPLTANHAILSSQKEDGTMLDIGHFPMPLTEEEIAIPLHVEASESGEFTLTATDFNLPSSMSLYLKDTETGSIVEIREGFEYTFTLSAAKQATPDQGLGSSCSTEPQKVAPVSQTRFLLVNEASVENSELPLEISLEQNYPNPFNPTTVINYHRPASMDVTLQVFDMTGRRVAVLQQGTMPAGSHTVNFDATNLSSGVYMYSLQAGQQVFTRKLTLIK